MERLNKYLAHAGVGSRRHCDDLIAAGRVKINGRVVRDLGIKVDPSIQKVAVDDQDVKVEKPVYWVVNKPPGYLCTNHDPAKRPLASDLIPHVEQRVYTVGRLDEASEGMLLMTNDGELANALMHPKFGVEKTYLVLVAGKPSPQDLQQLLDGVWLADGKVKAKAARRVKAQGESTWVRVVLAEGKNREIRRMLAKLNHKVLKLRRVAIGPILLDKLPKGKARKLSLPELELLQKTVTETRKRIERAAETGEATEDAPRAPRPLPPRRPGGNTPPPGFGARPPRPVDGPPRASGGPPRSSAPRPPRPRDGPPREFVLGPPVTPRPARGTGPRPPGPPRASGGPPRASRTVDGPPREFTPGAPRPSGPGRGPKSGEGPPSFPPKGPPKRQSSAAPRKAPPRKGPPNPGPPGPPRKVPRPPASPADG